ncbi:MAG: hypothetical protein IK133_02210 [Clostridia bacterium]|nr:hypothetical protein [Clostridia bacterium]MBR5382610.1 hypothetical protein [Clostridia bacterium]
MYIENKIISKAYRKAKISCGIGWLFLAVCAVLLVMGIAQFAQAKKNTRSLGEILQSADSGREKQMAYVELLGMFYFAEQDDDKEFFIGYDDERYYLLTTNAKGYEYCAKQYENKTDRLFRVTGYTEAIPRGARSYAITGLNEATGQKTVTSTNFDEVFGKVGLTVLEESRLNGIAGFMEVVSGEIISIFILLGIIGLILFLAGRSQMKTFTRTLGPDNPQADELIGEINSPETEWIAEVKTYVTEDYLVSVTSELSAVRYKDIFWIYRTRHSTNGMHDYDYLNVISTDGKRHMIARGKAGTKKRAANTEEVHERLLNLVAERNPEAMSGFSKENQTAYNELRKELKAKKAGA